MNKSYHVIGTLLVCAAMFLGIAGCGEVRHEYRLATPGLLIDREVAKELVEIFEESSRHSISLVPLPDPTMTALEAVESGVADLALTSNSQPYRQGVTTVMPFYPTVLHILYKNDRDADDVGELLRGASIYAGPVGSASYQVMLTILRAYGLSETDIEIVANADGVPDVIVLYLPLSPEAISTYLEATGTVGRYRMLSLGSLDDLGTGSGLDRALLLNPRLRPFVVPLDTYGSVTPGPVVTLSVDKMLIASPELEQTDVYDLIEELRRLQPALLARKPLLFARLSDEFSASDSTFVLHPGAQAFIDRDAPDIYERYSGVAEVLVTLLIGFVSGSYALVQIYNRRRKNRIDQFYVDVMAVRDAALAKSDPSDRGAAVAEVRQLQNRAIRMLVDEKLAADDSFRIFLTLSNDIIAELDAAGGGPGQKKT
ncbi:MAG: hypothetical protein KJP17_09570 [Gammaproteobacteria bacterium]|nr:hypothetical protein [Gammaproteobacteria bacterium]